MKEAQGMPMTAPAPAAQAPAAAPVQPARSGKRKINPLLVGGLIAGALLLVAVLAVALGIFGGQDETASQATVTTYHSGAGRTGHCHRASWRPARVNRQLQPRLPPSHLLQAQPRRKPLKLPKRPLPPKNRRLWLKIRIPPAAAGIQPPASRVRSSSRWNSRTRPT